MPIVGLENDKIPLLVQYGGIISRVISGDAYLEADFAHQNYQLLLEIKMSK